MKSQGRQRNAILHTWGRKCNKLLFVMGGAEIETKEEIISNKTLLITVPTFQHYGNIWKITQLAFFHVFRYYFGSFDWLIKCDVDSFVIMENLRLFLYHINGKDPFYYGLRLNQPVTGVVYNTGGPGYIISHDNFGILIKSFNNEMCKTKKIPAEEDIEVANCFRLVRCTECVHT